MSKLNGKQIKDTTITAPKLNLGGGYYPTTSSDVVNKYFIDSFTSYKAPVRVSTVSNIPSILSASQATIQGACDLISAISIILSPTNRILVRAQTNPTENGIYTWDGVSLTRSTDLDTSAMFIDGSLVFSQNGDIYGNTYFFIDIPNPFILGASSVTLEQINNRIQFFDVLSNVNLVALTTARKGDISFVGSTIPKDTWILTDLPATTIGNWKKLGTNNFSLAGTINIGLPTDGQYGTLESITGLSSGDLLEDALDKIDTFLELISPSRGFPLTSQSLAWDVSNPTRYQGKLSDGLAGSWYLDSDSPGDLVDVIYSGSFFVTVPSTPGVFDINLYFRRPDWGIAEVLYNNSADATVNIAVASMPAVAPPYLDTTSNCSLSIDTVSIYNSIWTEAKATITNLDLLTEGLKKIELFHSTAGTSNDIKVFFQNGAPAAPTFSVVPSVMLNSGVYKLLSGIQYYTTGSQFQLSYTAASGIFDKTYHATAVSTYSGTGFLTTDENPAVPPNYTSPFAFSDAVDMTEIDQSSGGILGSIDVTIRNTDGASTVLAVNLDKPVCTYGTVSTASDEYFFDETERLVVTSLSTYGSTPYNSSTFDFTFDAQVRNGMLTYPYDADYSYTFTGNKEYQRIFDVGVRSNGIFDLVNLFHSDISPYGTGDINILVRLDNATNYALTTGAIFDLGTAFGIDNGTGDGDTRANSIGAKVTGLSAGSDLAFSFGTYSTALNSNSFRVIVIFRTNNLELQNLLFS